MRRIADEIGASNRHIRPIRGRPKPDRSAKESSPPGRSKCVGILPHAVERRSRIVHAQIKSQRVGEHHILAAAIARERHQAMRDAHHFAVVVEHRPRASPRVVLSSSTYANGRTA